MARVPKGQNEGEEPPADKAFERLKQFEESRRVPKKRRKGEREAQSEDQNEEKDDAETEPPTEEGCES